MSADIFSLEVPALLQSHFDHLNIGSGISVSVITERGYESVLGKKRLIDLGFSPAQQRIPGILIPLYNVDGKNVGYQYRPDNPRLNPKGKPIKYENLPSSALHIDVPPSCRPLLGNPTWPIFWVEGVKKADSLASHDVCAVGLNGVWGFKGKNPLGGTTILADFDYISLKARDAYVVYDSDYAYLIQVRWATDRLSEHLRRRGANVRVCYLPAKSDGTKQGADDFLAAGHTMSDLIGLAVPFEEEVTAENQKKKTASEKSEEDESYATAIVNALADSHLFHDTVGDPFIRFNRDGHWETWPLDSQSFESYASLLIYKQRGKSPNRGAITDAIATLSGAAKFEGPRHDLNLRVAWHDEALWYDLCDEKWRALRIDKYGWKVIDAPPLIFERHAHMLPQVEPMPGGDIRRLLDFVNISDKADQLLLLVWLVSAFFPGFPHPALMPYGTWGSGKTFLFRMLKALVDPSGVETLSFATNKQEFAQQLSHHWCALYDNIHSLPFWISDILCRAITGEGFSKRQLYTNREDVLFKFKRIVGIDGLELAAESPDLLDRSIILELSAIADENRKQESNLWANFVKAKPQILGATFDVIIKALNVQPLIDVKQLPRMADWTVWGCAIAEALGYGQAKFLQAYGQAVVHQSLEALKANLIGETLLAFMESRDEYEDTVASLLKDLSSKAEQLHIDTKAKGWPRQPNQLSKTLKPMAPNLAKEKLAVNFLGHTKGGSKIRITKIPSPPSPQIPTEGDDTNDNARLGDDTTVTESCIEKPSSPMKLALGDGGDGENHSLLLDSQQVSEILKVWQKEGAPLIHLAPGVSCEDLERFLSKQQDPLHMKVVMAWFDQHKQSLAEEP